jgi:hypothetical protein
MGFFSKFFGRKSEAGEGASPASPETLQSTPLAPTSPAPGSAEAQQATVSKLSENLANLQQTQAVFKEPGQSTSIDNAQADTLAKKIESVGGSPASVPPPTVKPEFAPTPSPESLTRVSQGLAPQQRPESKMTNDQLAAEVNQVPTPIDVVREATPVAIPHTATPAGPLSSVAAEIKAEDNAATGATKPPVTSAEKKTA